MFIAPTIRKASHYDCDILADKLVEWAVQARQMPPSYDSHGISAPLLLDAEGRMQARMLPGRGLLLPQDLKSVGITKPLPGVFERGRVLRGIERRAKLLQLAEVLWRDEAAVISSYDQIINARANGGAVDRSIAKASATTVANQWSSLFQSGGNPGAGAYSATPGTAPNNATAGALSLAFPNPTGSNAAYLLSFGYNSASAINMLLMADLLAQVGSLSANSISSQTVSSTALTRYTTGAGVLMTFDVTTAFSTTASNLTVTYTNQGGTGSRSTGAIALTTSCIVQRLQPAGLGSQIQLAAGDTGVRSVQSLILSAAMGAGVFALNLYFPLMWIPGIVANVYMERVSPSQVEGITNLPLGSDSALGCLVAYVQTNSTTSGALNGFFRTVQG